VGPRAVLDAVVKRKIPSPHQESNPRTPIVQLVTQLYKMMIMTTSLLEKLRIDQLVNKIPCRVWNREVHYRR
jgi:hypothetical protein